MISITPANNDVIKIIQITDTHIFADDNDTFDDIAPDETLKQVLELAKTSEQWPPDLVLATGDLVHKPLAVAYEKFHGFVNELGVPVFCLPGNHDDLELMPTLLDKGQVSTNKEILCGNWVVLMLNSYIPGTHSGELSKQELHWLGQKLEHYCDKSILIALHHHPVSIRSSWMDTMILNNQEDFLNTIEGQEQVKLVIWGHIHQEFSDKFGHTHLIGSPSTCVQFLPGATQYARDDKQAGFRQFRLFPNGDFETEVFRIGA